MGDVGHVAWLKLREGDVEKQEGIRLSLVRSRRGTLVMAGPDHCVLTLPAQPVAQHELVMAQEADDDNATSDDDGEDEDGEE